MKYILLNRHLANVADFSSLQWNLRPLHRCLEDGERFNKETAKQLISEIHPSHPVTHVLIHAPGNDQHGIEIEVEKFA